MKLCKKLRSHKLLSQKIEEKFHAPLAAVTTLLYIVLCSQRTQRPL